MNLYDHVSKQVLSLLETEGKNIVNGLSLNSPRAIGDAVQEFLAEEGGLKKCVPAKLLKKDVATL